MLPLNSHVSSFLAIPAELRKSIYDVADKQTLGRLAQTCKQVNADINPVVEKVGQEKRSPWDTLRKQEYPNFGLGTVQNLQPKNKLEAMKKPQAMEQPQSAQSLYQGARLQYRKRVQPRLERALEIVERHNYLTEDEVYIAWKSFNAAARHPKG